MKAPYCGECSDRSEIRKKVHSESAPSGTEEGRAVGRGDCAGERGEVKTEQDRCRPVGSGELHLTLCD